MLGARTGRVRVRLGVRLRRADHPGPNPDYWQSRSFG